MNGVKGYMAKEIYLRRKTFLSGMVGFLLLFILAASFCLSFDYGNMKNNASVSRDSAAMLPYLLSFMGIITFSKNGDINTKDIKCKWNIFERTLPLSAKKLAAVRVGITLAENLIGTAVSVGLGAVILALAHKKMTVGFFANNFAISLIVFLLVIISNYMLLRFKDPQKASLCFIIVFIVIYTVFCVPFLSVLKYDDISEEEMGMLINEKILIPFAEWRDRLFPFVFLIYSAIAVIGYFLLFSTYERRENFKNR